MGSFDIYASAFAEDDKATIGFNEFILNRYIICSMLSKMKIAKIW